MNAFLRQMLGLSIGGEFQGIRIKLTNIDNFRIIDYERSADFYMHIDRDEQGRKVHILRTRSLQRWNDGSVIAKEERERLVAAIEHWSRSHGYKYTAE
jgi:hypothetical protein